jgi:tRNA-Thr(GGU) m(6)t(6)A37 methyltransferase TsaA
MDITTGSAMVSAIGRVRNDRTDPANSDYWGDVVSTIEIEERFGDDCLTGLQNFSHVEVVYLFDRAAEKPDYRPLLRPRGRSDLPEVGVFSDRGPRRPNRLGVTRAEVVSATGRRLRVRGLDAVDGTPVLDIKPLMREFLPTDVRQPAWVGELMRDYFAAAPPDRSSA